ncbi:hypothetical protein LY76DRAFT_590836 [Colletotrichum caudatum]|nr:hypothetical protein LY76DRAFT_590836 [Colletotrichum caudatum]
MLLMLLVSVSTSLQDPTTSARFGLIERQSPVDVFLNLSFCQKVASTRVSFIAILSRRRGCLFGQNCCGGWRLTLITRSIGKIQKQRNVSVADVHNALRKPCDVTLHHVAVVWRVVSVYGGIACLEYKKA